MNKIMLSEYNKSLGPLIDVRDPLKYAKKHDPRSTNIYVDKILLNYKMLDKNKTYYIICENGILSKRVVNYLNYLGYKAIQVIEK